MSRNKKRKRAKKGKKKVSVSEAQICPPLADIIRFKKRKFMNAQLGEGAQINEIITNFHTCAETGARLKYQAKITSWKILKWAQRNHINYHLMDDDFTYEFWISESPREYGLKSSKSFRTSDEYQEPVFDICCLCLNEKSDVFYSPCGHIISCQKCHPGDGTCHVCRAQVLSMHELDPSAFSCRPLVDQWAGDVLPAIFDSEFDF